MIRYFRNIRQQMTMKGTTSKYLRYAFGEIVLVAIGILMALSINNWNLNRIERNNELKILLDLQNEFIENLKDAQRVVEGNNAIVSGINQLQEYDLKEPLNTVELDSLLYFVFDWFDYTPKPGASNNLINSGNLNLLSNNELRKLLTLWSGVDDELDDDEQVAVNFSQNIIIPYMAQLYPIQNLERFDLSAHYYTNLKSNNNYLAFSQKVDYDYRPLLSDPTFKSHLTIKKLYAKHNALECLNVITTCQSILDLIDQDLNKRN